jgi:hypothetical protein
MVLIIPDVLRFCAAVNTLFSKYRYNFRMDATVHAVRAVAAELLRRKVKGVAVPVGSLLIALLALALYLTGFSGWWWLLVGLVVFALIVFALAMFVLRTILRVIGLRLNASQKAAVRQFVDKFETVLEHAQTPLPFLVLRIAWELLIRRRSTLIRDVVNDAATLKPDFADLQAQFKTTD